MAHTCNPSYSGGRDQEIHGLSQPGQIVLKTLSRKILSQKRAGAVAQVVEHLPSKCEALSSKHQRYKNK
jgi:hypothetical protein